MKNMIRTLLVVSFALSLSACMSMPPPPDDWELWEKTGVKGQDDIKKTMLECGETLGVGAPLDFDVIKRNLGKYVREGVLIDRCMEKDGFRYTGEMGTTCSRHPDTPECKLPIEQIPSRDISRRLNGVYCTKFPTAELCKP